MLIAAIVGLVLFTSIFGRIFCGWFCPQTIFMEMFFRKIEYFIEGDYTKQKALDKMPWNKEKIFKKTAKHIIFLALSFIIGNVLLTYLIGTQAMYDLITDPIKEHIGGFSTMIGFTGIFYFIFAKMREQVCTMACPYGRLQGVLIDPKTIVVAYDYKRGEPRGKIRKGEERTLGACIDCKQCVHVCPTGIDIRQGTQLECINCTACIDACDEIMELTNQPTGLIRYDSIDGIKNGTKLKWNARIIAYSSVLIIMLGVIVYMFSQREILDGSILRGQSTSYQKIDETTYRNIYNYKILNKSYEEVRITIKIINKNAKLTFVGGNAEIIVPPADLVEGVFFLELDTKEMEGNKTDIQFGMYELKSGTLVDVIETKFLGPGKYEM